MFWDHISGIYDIVETVYNARVYQSLGKCVTAVQELVRVCKPGGTIIIPTYINLSQGRTSKAARLFELCGVEFKRQFDAQSYRQFFAQAGFPDARFTIVDGRMPCAIAILNKHS